MKTESMEGIKITEHPEFYISGTEKQHIELQAIAKKYTGYSIWAIIILKALDTTISLFVTNGNLGIFWLLFIAAMVIPVFYKEKSIVTTGICFFLGFKLGPIFLSFLGMVTGIVLIGFVFGYPLGRMIGNSAGLIQKLPSDNNPFNKHFALVFLKGILIPLIALSILIPAYLWWFNPLVNQWIQNFH